MAKTKQLPVKQDAIELAKKTLQEAEEKKYNLCLNEVNAVLEKHGYDIASRGQFIGNQIQVEHFLVKKAK